MNIRPSILPLIGALLLAPAIPARAGSGEQMDYDITWVGVSVGTMSVHSRRDDTGAEVRSIRIWNRPWIARIYPVDNTVECRIEATDEGPRHRVTKQMGEKGFVQDDTLELWPEAGRATWSNALSNTVHHFEVPKGSRDFVSFFFDLRDAAADGSWADRGDYQLVMDQGLHALQIDVGRPERIRTPFGRLDAIRVTAVSKSPELFSRNKPKAVWVATARPAVVFADVDTRFGAVRATLAKWEINGQSAWDDPPDAP